MKLDDFLKFKKVRYINIDVKGFTKNKEYELLGVTDRSCIIINDYGFEIWASLDNFEPVSEPVSEPLADTLKWFELALPEPTTKSLATQFGCHLEEVAEMLEVMGDIQESQWVDGLADFYKQSSDCNELVPLVKKDADKDVELLDSLCDQIVTALGVGYMFGFDMQSALAEVVRSNFSKFENGKPVFDENGKIKKGANYTPPQLGEFI